MTSTPSSTPSTPSGPATASPSSLVSYCQAVADGTIAPATGLRGLWRRAACLLVGSHRAGVPF